MTVNIWLSGYRSYELGVFKDDDPKVTVIKQALRKELINLLDRGLEWVLTGLQLGVEQWGIEVCLELKSEYPQLKIGALVAFSNFGQQWQEVNQSKLVQLKSQVDFFGEVSKYPYRSPQQLRNYQNFMLSHCQGALLVYDPEFEGKSKYDYQVLKEREDLNLSLIDMDQLQNEAELYQEKVHKENDY